MARYVFKVPFSNILQPDNYSLCINATFLNSHRDDCGYMYQTKRAAVLTALNPAFLTRLFAGLCVWTRGGGAGFNKYSDKLSLSPKYI